MFQDMTAKYCIYNKVPLKLMSFFVFVKGCVNFHEMTSSQYIKNAYSIVNKSLSRLPKHYTPLHLYIPALHHDFIY